VSRLVVDTFRQIGSGGVEAVTSVQCTDRAKRHQVLLRFSRDQVLGLVLRNAVGRPVAGYLQEKIWEPIGPKLMRPGSSTALAKRQRTACLNAVLRDYARLGLLLAHDGHWRGRQIIPAAWIKEATIVRPGQRSPLAAATGIRSGYWRATGDVRTPGHTWPRRSSSIRRAASSWSTRRSENRPAIQASERKTLSGRASCNSSAISAPAHRRVSDGDCGTDRAVSACTRRFDR